MLSRLIPKSSHFRNLLLVSSKSHLNPLPPHFSYSKKGQKFLFFSKYFSTNNNNNNGKDDFWRNFGENEVKFDARSLGGFDDKTYRSTGEVTGDDQWWLNEKGLDNQDEDALFKRVDKETEEKDDGFGGNQWTGTGAEDLKPWSLKEDEKDVFGFEEDVRELRDPKDESTFLKGGEDDDQLQSEEDAKKLQIEEQALTAIVKGPNRAFGDMIAASGITDEMLDSLMALRDFEGVEGLPPLSAIEDMRYEKNTRKSTRAEIERQKQEEIAKARVRQVDEKGRAYGTGRRKCSVARVWVQPGNGKFIVNDKEFDIYFPMLDHRATLLRPFSETKTLGLWDVNCTVKGGGVSGQVGAVRLGISRALQNWEPDLRPALRNAGFLTRDPRVVERKKPGKAKARRSFQWVKR
ncbi:hypothetical protein L6164_025394 [Bauhinia variegata]|uniref:Uncharacterized protein n=1 Tax=Bauhinia variegata TaxID=167791 RepID=A0ACB9M0G6_BAUVA|nr:hypothetical protein L6164_025394 [Bauhinia variegata]